MLHPLLETADRAWWARIIRRADVVDLDYVIAQGGPASVRRAIRAYVGGRFRTGMSLNPLFMERLVSSQLSDAGRVPALYAYLVNDPRAIEVSTAWDAPAFARREPSSRSSPGGPLGAVWRAARDSGTIELGTGSAPRIRVPWAAVHARAIEAVRAARGLQVVPSLPSPGSELVFVCHLSRDEGIPARPMREAAEVAVRADAELIIAIDGGSAETWTAAALMGLWLPFVRVQRETEDPSPATTGAGRPDAVLLVRGAHAEIGADDLLTLAALGAAGPVSPLWLDWDGSVAAAAIIVRDGRREHLLAGHPAEDAHALGAFLPSFEPTGDTHARRLDHDPRAGARTALDIVVRAPAAAPPRDRVDVADTDLARIVAPLGIEVSGHADAAPRFTRRPRNARLADGSTIPSLRWAIKIAAPPGEPGEAWGDTHFARGLADALRRLGQEVVIDAYAARERASAYLDDVVLALRGPEPLRPQPGARSLLWIISHPDEIDAAGVTGFDRVFAASAAWSAEASTRLGRTVEPLLQCTDVERFHPAGLPRSGGLVFVGTARGIARPSVVEPLRAGVPVAVYGPDWRGYIPADAIVATGISNKDLPALYEAAGAVLNDHWPAMRRHGFISNRLFDVVAAGGRAISDDVEGIREIFAGAVATYDTTAGLLDIVRGDLEDAFPSEAELRDIGDRIRADHSFDARARTLLSAALERDQTTG
jgi:hypothetical protein